MQPLGLSWGESRGMIWLLVPRGARPAGPSIHVSRAILHPWDLPHQLIQLIVMGPVLAGGATPSGEQSSPAQEWVTPLHVPRELSTGGTWECTGV